MAASGYQTIIVASLNLASIIAYRARHRRQKQAHRNRYVATREYVGEWRNDSIGSAFGNNDGDMTASTVHRSIVSIIGIVSISVFAGSS